MESKGRIFLLTILILFAGVEISAECYKRCHKDYIQTCNISGHKCVKTETRGYKCMPNEGIIDPCDKSPCQNGGTCTGNGDGYTCTCTQDYRGTDCESIIGPCDKSPCQNGGTCTGNGDGYTCTCTQDYRGTDCEIPGCNAKFGTTKCLHRDYYVDRDTYVYYERFSGNSLNFYYYFEYPGGKLCGCSDICLDEGNCCHDSDC